MTIHYFRKMFDILLFFYIIPINFNFIFYTNINSKLKAFEKKEKKRFYRPGQ